MRNPWKTGNRVLYRAFRDTRSYLDDLFLVYNSLYTTIPHVNYSEKLQDKYSFSYCQARKYFVLVIPYTKHYELLVERSFAQNKLSWALIGGSLRADLMESFIDAANRHAAKTIGNLELGEVEPITFLENRFEYNNVNHYHRGIAFAARIRNTDPIHDLRNAMYSRSSSRGFLVPYDDTSVPWNLRNSEETVEIMRRYLNTVDIGTAPEFEVSENIKYQNRYKIHESFVKPMFRTMGKYYFEHSIQDLEDKIVDILLSGPHERILDLACGENRAVIEFAHVPGTKLVVGNDVSWSQVQLMEAQVESKKFRNNNSFVLFTNHDARRLPFTPQFFDFTICKNALHHMDNLRSASDLIQQMLRVSKRALIVEVMDPFYESTWGRLRHRYYLDFLRDAGNNFLSRAEFNAMTDLPERKIMFEMRTIRGVYMFALFSNEGD